VACAQSALARGPHGRRAPALNPCRGQGQAEEPGAVLAARGHTDPYGEPQRRGRTTREVFRSKRRWTAAPAATERLSVPEDPPEAQDVGLQAMRCLQGEKQRRQEAVVQLQHARAQMAREVRNALRAAVAGIMFAGAEVLLAFSDGTATLRDAEAGWKAALDEQEVAEKQAAREAGRVFHMFINDRVAHTSHRASLNVCAALPRPEMPRVRQVPDL